MIGMAGLSACGSEDPPHGDQVKIIKTYVDAYNERDLETMALQMNPDIQWLNVDGDKIEIVTNGKDELVEMLEGYFEDENFPKTISSITQSLTDGPYVAAQETVSWTDDQGTSKSQTALAVYEFKSEQIIRVWYYSETSQD